MNNLEILLLATALVFPASASSVDSWKPIDVSEHNITLYEKNGIAILSWHPQVIEYVYVNDTVSKTFNYSVTTVKPLAMSNWTVDGIPVTGTVNGNTYFHIHTWDNKSFGFHTLVYRGGSPGSYTEFRWYVNVYETEGYDRSSIFDILDDALDNQNTELKIQMLEYRISKNGDYEYIAAREISNLNEESAARQKMRKALNQEFKAGNITLEKYIAAFKQVRREAKYNTKLAKEMAKIARTTLKNEKLGREFENFSIIEESRERGE